MANRFSIGIRLLLTIGLLFSTELAQNIPTAIAATLQSTATKMIDFMVQ